MNETDHVRTGLDDKAVNHRTVFQIDDILIGLLRTSGTGHGQKAKKQQKKP